MSVGGPVREPSESPENEEQFLAQQAAAGKCGMSHAMQDAKETLVALADGRSLVRRHPWIVTGVAATWGLSPGR